eukprot:6345829-Pyramimonas_sp.AAC.2
MPLRLKGINLPFMIPFIIPFTIPTAPQLALRSQHRDVGAGDALRAEGVDSGWEGVYSLAISRGGIRLRGGGFRLKGGGFRLRWGGLSPR